jgi:methylated-DNA-[protein]-cysteine S-methyltransferase
MRRPDVPTLARETSTEQISVFPTQFGWIALSMHLNVLQRLSFGHDSALAAVAALGARLDEEPTSAVSAGLASLRKRLIRYTAGEFDEFLDIESDTSHLSQFAAAVVEAVRRIPLGETRSYGQIATIVGRPRASRAVGHVMAQNRTPLVVPCHRVVASGGGLGGFSAMDGIQTKRRLLELETRMVVARQ